MKKHELPSRAKDRSEGEEARTRTQQLPKLADDLLLLQVFSRLPLPCIYLFRALSKRWCAELSSGPFLQAWSRLHAEDRWLVVGDVRYDAPDQMPSDPQLFAYDYSPPPLAAVGGTSSRCSSWLRIPLFSPGPRLLPRPLYPLVMSYRVLADSAGGLVCAIARIDADAPAPHPAQALRADPFSAHASSAQPAVQFWNFGSESENDWFTLVVFNPLTGQSRTLPAPPSIVPLEGGSSMQEIDPHWFTIIMLAAPTTSSYQVILCCGRLGTSYCFGGMVIFSSQTNSWTTIPTSRFMQKISITAASMQDDQGWCSSVDLILKADFFEWDPEKFVILGCSLHPQVTWWELSGPFPVKPAPDDVDDVPLFFVHRGRLLFAQALLFGFVPIGFTVWELQPGSSSTPSLMNWVVFAETPLDMQKGIGAPEKKEDYLIDRPPAIYKLVHSGSLLCLVIENITDDICDYADEAYFVSSLTYDLDRGSWSRLPPIDAVTKLGKLFVGGFSFQPSFTATV